MLMQREGDTYNVRDETRGVTDESRARLLMSFVRGHKFRATREVIFCALRPA